MSPNTPLLVVSGRTLLVVPGSTFFVVPRLATTLLRAAASSPKLRDSLRFVFFVITEERADPVLGVLEETGSSALSVSKRAVECVLGIRKQFLSLTRHSGLLLLIECHYIQRSENNDVGELPSTGLEPAVLTLGGSRLIQLGYEG